MPRARDSPETPATRQTTTSLLIEKEDGFGFGFNLFFDTSTGGGVLSSADAEGGYTRDIVT
jgi:hypothetical protein